MLSGNYESGLRASSREMAADCGLKISRSWELGAGSWELGAGK